MRPTSMIATMSREVPTGRWMKIRDGFMSRPGLLVGLGGSTGAAAAAFAVAALRAARLTAAWAATLLAGRRHAARRGRRVGVGRRRGDGLARVAGRTAWPANLGAVAQAVGAIDHHLVANREALD